MNFTSNELNFYSRHIHLNEIGISGQLKLSAAKVLVIGAGGLGCPVLQYLAAAGVGTLGVIDSDHVEYSNLHRQVLFTVEDIGKLKAECAVEHLTKKNPFIQIHAIAERMTATNAIAILNDYDLVVDGSDNFPTRYMINDACVLTGKSLIYGSVFKFTGQAAVFNYILPDNQRSATYRCLYPSPPEPGFSGDCSEVGILGVLPGIIGTIMASEVIKIITGHGEVLSNNLFVAELTSMNFTKFQLERNEASWGVYPHSIEAFSTMNYEYFCNSSTGSDSITAADFDTYLTSREFQILDVRDPHELPEVIAPNVIRIPLAELSDRIMELDNLKPVIAICSSGNRSLLAIKVLRPSLGANKLINLEGGILKWVELKQITTK